MATMTSDEDRTLCSPLLRLPLELKLMIYDLVLESIYQHRTLRNLNTYVLPSEWQTKLDFSDYHALNATCKEVRAEVKAHFERDWVPGLMFHFNNVPDLWRFANAVRKLDPVYSEVRICLRGLWPSIRPRLKEAEKVMRDTYEFISMQREDSKAVHTLLRTYECFKLESHPGGIVNRGPDHLSPTGAAILQDAILRDAQRRFRSGERWARDIQVLQLPVPAADEGANAVISIHKLKNSNFLGPPGEQSGTYAMLKSRLCDLKWEKFSSDPAERHWSRYKAVSSREGEWERRQERLFEEGVKHGPRRSGVLRGRGCPWYA